MNANRLDLWCAKRCLWIVRRLNAASDRLIRCSDWFTDRVFRRLGATP